MMPMPAVAGLLNAHYVEARHHTDHPDDELANHNIALQLEMQGDISLPFYMLIDPKTDKVYATHAGLALTTKTFVDFLQSGVEQSGLEQVAQRD